MDQSVKVNPETLRLRADIISIEVCAYAKCVSYACIQREDDRV